jgi:RNA polymerase sigma-70 factor (ECF subfamily)
MTVFIDNETNAQLVTRMRAGDVSAFETIVERYRAVLIARAHARLGSFADAEDVAQEAFVQAYTQLHTLRDQDKFGPWLRRITSNLCVEAIRRRRSVASLDDIEDTPIATSDDDPRKATTRLVVRDALAKLSDEKRITTTLCYINGYSHAEVAGILEVPLATVRSRLQSAKKQLSKEMITLVKDVLTDSKQKVRINNPRTHRADLIEDTEDDELNLFLYGVVNILDIAFGKYLRSIYLVKTFQIDDLYPIVFIFRDPEGMDQREPVWAAVHQILHLSKYKYMLDPLYRGSDRPFYDPNDRGEEWWTPCDALMRVAVKEDSLLLWGEDIRPRIALASNKDLLRDVVIPPLNRMKQTHNATPDGKSPLDTKLIYPLADPRPDAKDRGFGTDRNVPFLVLHLARALILINSGQLVLQPDRIAGEYERHVGGAFVDLVRDGMSLRSGEVSAASRRTLLREVCRRLTAFENYFVEALSTAGIDVSAHVLC